MNLTTKGYGKKKITLADISNLISDEEIFKYYISNFKKIDRPFCSELRKDNSPSCTLKKFRNGDIMYKDWSTGEVYTPLGYVAKKYNISKADALKVINDDFNLNITSSKGPIKKEPIEMEVYEEKKVEIQVFKRPWNRHQDKLYWSQYYITAEELNDANIYPIKAYSLRGKLFVLDKYDPAYCYEVDKGIYKILRPYAKDRRFKWISNTKKIHYQGYNNLPWFGDLLVVTKSMKDVVLLSKFNIPSIAPLSEGMKIDHDFMKSLKKRFKTIIIFYDNDEAGLKGAKLNCKEHNLDSVIIPVESKVKDISDYIKEYGILETKKLINNLFNEYRTI